MVNEFDYSEDKGPCDDEHLKCSGCGYEKAWNRAKLYKDQSDCPKCKDQMMGIRWAGWADNGHNKNIPAQPKTAANKEVVSQESEPFDSFNEEERTIAGGLVVVKEAGTEAPWLGAFGACLVKVYGIRRNTETDKVEFGIGNEAPPILGWVTADQFFNEWPQ